jgi:hypothetical protein
MNPLKLRRLLISIHLYVAGFMAPAILLMAMTGGLHLAGASETMTRTEIALPANAELDFNSETLEADIRTLLDEAGIDHRFEYVRGRGDMVQLRPTSRTFLELAQTPDGLKATRVQPNLMAGLMELHKGHGPRLYRLYGVLVGLALAIAVLGGILVGWLAPAYRRTTMIATGLGLIPFILIGFIL